MRVVKLSAYIPMVFRVQLGIQVERSTTSSTASLGSCTISWQQIGNGDTAVSVILLLFESRIIVIFSSCLFPSRQTGEFLKAKAKQVLFSAAHWSELQCHEVKDSGGCALPYPPTPFIPLLWQGLPYTVQTGKAGALGTRQRRAKSAQPAEATPQSHLRGKEVFLAQTRELMHRSC